MTYPDLVGKSVLVTGAGTGIGRAIAREFGRQGARVIVHYSHNHQRTSAEAVCAEINHDGEAVSIRADFAVDGETTHLARQALSTWQGVDIVVNNAGITLNQPIEKITAAQCDLLFAVNVRAPLLITKLIAPQLRESGGGSIINLSSVHAYSSVAGHSIYAATKGAIIAMTRQLAIELAPDKIRVNAIAPGWIETEYQHSVMEFDAADIGSKIPAGRIGQPEDVAKLATWLASDQSSYITGQTITIDGGMTSWLPVNEDWSKISEVPFGRGYVPGM